MSRLRLALAVLMIGWACFDALYAEPHRWLQVAEDFGWLALIVFWPQVRRGVERVASHG